VIDDRDLLVWGITKKASFGVRSVRSVRCMQFAARLSRHRLGSRKAGLAAEPIQRGI
jgi:hypothetical protein